MTRRQADTCIRSALALGFKSAIPSVLGKGRFKVVLERANEAGGARLCAWTYNDWLTIMREEMANDVPF